MCTTVAENHLFFRIRDEDDGDGDDDNKNDQTEKA